MRIDYEISEQDFLNAQKLAIRKSPQLVVRMTALVIPIWGAFLSAFLVWTGLKQGLSWNFLPGLFFGLLMLSLPLINRRAQRKMYAKATSMHGKVSLETDDTGVSFSGPSFSSHQDWKNFFRFLEDDKTFLLYQSTQVFNPIPKRMLLPQEIEDLRNAFTRNIAGKS